MRFTRNVGAALSTIALLLIVELTVQGRSQILTGRSVFNLRGDASTFVYHEDLGFSLLRPGHTVRGTRTVVSSNRLGLRGAEIARHPGPSEWRMAILGASSIYGATTARNEDTVSARLEYELSRITGRETTVINAGIPGLTIEKMRIMLERVILPLRPEQVIFYPGFQHISGACRKRNRQEDIWSLAVPGLPAWVQADDIVVKNTAFIREKPYDLMGAPPELSEESYKAGLAALMQTARSGGADLILTTAARGYRADLSEADNIALSSNIRMFAPCFSAREVVIATGRFNDVIRTFAQEHGLKLVDLEQAVPGGWAYFDDGNHFSEKGEERVAHALSMALTDASDDERHASVIRPGKF